MDIGFIGLGQMGRGMAARLLERGYRLRAWNRTRAAAEGLVSSGASLVDRPEELFDADVVITMLADDAAVDAVWIAGGFVEKLARGSLHLNMSSVSLGMARQLSALHERAATAYVSAPVFGRPEPAARGELDIVAAGEASALERCVPLFEALGRRWFDVGREPHQANIVKIARNFLLGTIIESLGEAFALVSRSGVGRAKFLEIITSTSLGAPAYVNYGRMMLHPSAQPTFPLRLGLKDIEIALDAARDNGLDMPFASILRAQHVAAIDGGYGEKDWAELANWICERRGA